MRLKLFFRDSGDSHMSCDYPRTGRTCVVILRGSKIDQYRYPLLFPLFGRRSGTRPRQLCIFGDSERKGGKQTPLAWTWVVGVASAFIRLWCASTGWQSLKCTSHPLLCQVTIIFEVAWCSILTQQIKWGRFESNPSDTCRLLIKWLLEIWGFKSIPLSNPGDCSKWVYDLSSSSSCDLPISISSSLVLFL